jgi:hypothetical protein
VLTIRCTRKLLERLDVEASSVPLHPTNRLGDWYANLLFTGRARLIICVSERTLLPVFVEAGPPILTRRRWGSLKTTMWSKHSRRIEPMTLSM